MQLTPTYSIYRNDVVVREKPASLSDNDKVKTIINTVCTYGSLNRDILTSPWRKREICELRHIAMELIRKNTSLSLVNIGVELGGRDHSSVISGITKVNDLFDTDKQFRDKYLQVQYLLSAEFELTNPKK